MRRILTTTFLAAAGLIYGLGADGDPAGDDARRVFLVYSADERSELAPCG
jgi:hypothetical protein